MNLVRNERISLSPVELNAAARDGLITNTQAKLLWARWTEHDRLGETVPGALAGPRLRYYFGGLLAALLGLLVMAWGLWW